LVYPSITNESLLSIGQLCDDNCIALFTKQALHIFKNDNLIMKGIRNQQDRLWDVPFNTNLHTPSSSLRTTQKYPTSINYIVQKDQSKSDLSKYLHGCAFSPVISTFIKSINNDNFITWPGIEELNLNTSLSTTIATEKGHLDQERKNLQSTKTIIPPSSDTDTHPLQIPSKTHQC
jgi:hypothetical protein